MGNILSDRAEVDSMRRGKKIHTAAIGMLCLATFTTSACVTRSTYDSATADLGAVKGELYSARAETQGLIQQAGDLQRRQVDLAGRKESASAALQQATKKLKAEHAGSQKRLGAINRTIQQLIAQQKSLRYVIKRATKEQARLQSAVESLSKLGEQNKLNASPVPSPAEPVNEPAKTALVPPAQTPVPNEPVPKPIVMTTAAPVNQPVAAQKSPAPRIQPSEPVEEDWLSFLKNWIASLWQSVVFY
jgi:hypothetical protein